MIYAKLVDHAGNVTYINSNGIIIDKTLPVIEGVENNKTYCSPVEITVTEENLDTVTVNGKQVDIIDGKFTVNPANSQQTIIVTDKALNSITYVITVNDGHTFENYSSNNDATCTQDGTETAKCEFCDATDTRIDENSALGHNFVDGVCVVDGVIDENYKQESNTNSDKNITSPLTGVQGSVVAILGLFIVLGALIVLTKFSRKVNKYN